MNPQYNFEGKIALVTGASRLFPIIGDPITYVESPVWLTRTLGMLHVVSVIRRNPDGTWHGDMLDGLASVKTQQDHGARIDGSRALLVGAGGAGSAIAIAGHGTTPFIGAAQAAGCQTTNGGHMVEAVQALMADFMLGK